MGRRFGSSPNKSFSSPNRWAEDFQKPLASGRPGLDDRRFNQASGGAGRGVGSNSLGRDLGPSGDQEALGDFLRNQLDPRRIAGGVMEQIINGGGIKKPDGFYDWIPNNPNGGAFISDVNDTVEKRPSDCRRWPDSPFCKLPLGHGPLGVGADLGVTKCEVCITFRLDVAFNRIPINTFCYRRRDAECYKPPKVPPEAPAPPEEPDEGGNYEPSIAKSQSAIWGFYQQESGCREHQVTTNWNGPGTRPSDMIVETTVTTRGCAMVAGSGSPGGLLPWSQVLAGTFDLDDAKNKAKYNYYIYRRKTWDVADPSNKRVYSSGILWMEMVFVAAKVVQWILITTPSSLRDDSYEELRTVSFTKATSIPIVSQDTYIDPYTGGGYIYTENGWDRSKLATVRAAVFATYTHGVGDTDAPPPPLPPPQKENHVTCCEQTDDRLDFIIRKLGLKTYPVIVEADPTRKNPKEEDGESTHDQIIKEFQTAYAWKEGEKEPALKERNAAQKAADAKVAERGLLKINDMTNFNAWIAASLMRAIGPFPISVDLKTDEEEEIKFEADSIAEYLLNMVPILMGTAKDSDNSWSLIQATLMEIVQNKAAITRVFTLCRAIVDGIGLNVQQKAIDLPVPFTIPDIEPKDLEAYFDKTNPEKIFKPSKMKIEGYEHKDKLTLALILSEIERVAKISASVNSEPVDKDNPEDGIASRIDKLFERAVGRITQEQQDQRNEAWSKQLEDIEKQINEYLKDNNVPEIKLEKPEIKLEKK